MLLLPLLYGAGDIAASDATFSVLVECYLLFLFEQPIENSITCTQIVGLFCFVELYVHI